jgi:transposase
MVRTMWNPAAALDLPSEQRQILQTWVHAKNTPQKVAFRAGVILMASAGHANREIARTLGTSRPTVLLWRQRFAEQGPQALLQDAPGRGRKVQIPAEKVQAIVEATLHTRPPAATHWSVRTMAKAQGVSPATVQRIWDANGLQPHRVKIFKLSRDKRFVEKLTDVVGLYLNPPDKAMVLCVDEKSQIQALDRTQPSLPMKKGRCGTMTHDYKRHGTTTLFAALNVLEGTVIGDCMPRHRHQEFLKFLRQIERQTPSQLDLHLILDNYGTHKHPRVQRWLTKHPRFHLHFTPTGSSWLNLVERWFRELTQKRIRRGAFCSVKELVGAIREYRDHNNKEPKPFVWRASAERILEKVARCKAIYETLH